MPVVHDPTPSDFQSLPSSSSSLDNRQTKQRHFDLGIALSLHMWEALAISVLNGWGGPDSVGKREWFAGVISETFSEQPDTDEIDLECMLLQIMDDEFDVRIEDESEVEVAAQICRIRRQCAIDDFSEVYRLHQHWKERHDLQQPGTNAQTNSEIDRETSGCAVQKPNPHHGAIVKSCGTGPGPVDATKVPEVDEEGFTKVSRKRTKA